MAGLLLIVAFFFSFFFFVYGIKQIVKFCGEAEKSKLKAIIFTVLTCAAIVIITVFGFGELHKHTNPYSMSLLASMYVGMQSWIIWLLAIILGLVGRLNKILPLVIMSSGLYMAPIVFSILHHNYWRELSVYFEYHIR